jgi:hypothetical protein
MQLAMALAAVLLATVRLVPGAGPDPTAPSCSVLDYGAKGDNRTEDTEVSGSETHRILHSNRCTMHETLHARTCLQIHMALWHSDRGRRNAVDLTRLDVEVLSDTLARGAQHTVYAESAMQSSSNSSPSKQYLDHLWRCARRSRHAVTMQQQLCGVAARESLQQ